MSKKSLIIGINGSPHQGHTRKLLNIALNEAKELGTEIEIIDLADFKILPHDGKLDPKNYQDKSEDDMSKLSERILKADGIIFASPTHWFNMSSLMKIFTDRLTSLEDYGFLLEGKVGGVITYGPQGGAFNNAISIVAMVNQMGMTIPPYGFIFDEGRGDDWVEKDCQLLAKNMLEQIKISANSKWGYGDEKYNKSPIELVKK